MIKMKKNNLKGTLILTLTALIWGLAFVAQAGAADKIPPFTVTALRSLIAAAILFITYKITTTNPQKRLFPKDKAERKTVITGGILCGVFLAVSANLQQAGIGLYPKNVAAEARAGFLTALYVIIVPVISVFFAKKIHPVVWCAVLTALAGVYFLCFDGGFSGIYAGDIVLICCAFSYSLHIIVIDKYCDPLGGIRLSCLQFLVCGTISAFLAVIFEVGDYGFSSVISAAPEILYLAVMSSGVAYTLQIIGQRYAEPAVASITMSLESVFAALGGWLIMGNSLSLKEILGCVLVFAAIITAQLPEFFKKGKTTP